MEMSLSSDCGLGDHLEPLRKLSENCSDMLCQIRSILNHNNRETQDIAHNVFWNEKLFGSIHGVLLATSISIYFYGVGMQAVGVAKELRESARLIHPCIAEALKVLSEAKQNDSDTCYRIKKCCFLLPDYLL